MMFSFKATICRIQDTRVALGMKTKMKFLCFTLLLMSFVISGVIGKLPQNVDNNELHEVPVEEEFVDAPIPEEYGEIPIQEEYDETPIQEEYDESSIEEEIREGPIEEEVETTCEINEALLERLLQLLFQAQGHAQRPLGGSSSARSVSSVDSTCGSVNSPMGHLKTARSFGILSDVCQNVTQQMEALIENLKSEVEDLVEAVLFDPTNYLRMMESVHEELIKLDVIITNLNATHNLKVEELMAEFETQKQCYLALVNQKLEDIRQMKATNDNALVEVIETDYWLNQFDDMEADLKDLTDDTRLQQVIEKIYNINHFEKMHKLYILGSSPQKGVILEKWYDMMQKKSHLTHNNVIVLRKLVRDLITEVGNQASQAFINLKTKVDSTTSSLLATLGAQIGLQNYASIVNFFSPTTPVSSIQFIGPYFSDVLPDLVTAAYNNTRSNLGALTKFVFALRWKIHRAIGLQDLNSKLSGDQDKLFIALKTKHALENRSGPDPSGPPELILEALKGSFKQQVRDVIWSLNCTLNNTEFNNIIYVGGREYDFDEYNKRVFASISSSGILDSRFLFGPVETSDRVHFFVHSFANGIIHLHDTDILNERYLVGIGPWNDQFRIELEGTDQIRLFHRWTPVYLYASPYLFSSTMRNVYLGYPNITEVQTGSYFQLKCT